MQIMNLEHQIGEHFRSNFELNNLFIYQNSVTMEWVANVCHLSNAKMYIVHENFSRVNEILSCDRLRLESNLSKKRTWCFSIFSLPKKEEYINAKVKNQAA